MKNSYFSTETVWFDTLASTITTVEKWLSNFRSPSEKVAEVFVTPLCWAKPSERSRKQAH